ncbi:hypothetical protein [Sporosarcina sp. FA9]|uniref:hypothetical protein n=1 Tax=Sporosarcina sp. FA9 TaxID=3413030 RepID=UPI003F65E49A
MGKCLEVKNATKLEQWLLFFKGDQETKEELAMESSTMQEALKEIQRLSEDPETRKAAIAREIHMKDQLQRELEAKMEGTQEGKAEIILNMYHNQYSVEAIAAITNVPIADVSRIVKSNIQ